jgi:PAS domain S-box-containing protein
MASGNAGGNGGISFWQTAITLVTGGGIAALVAGILKLLDYRRNSRMSDEDRQQAAKKQAREESRSEFDQMLAEYKGRVAELVKQLNELRAEFDSRYESQRKFWDDKFQAISSQHDSEIAAVRREAADQINRLRDESYRSRIEAEKLRGYVQLLQVSNSQLRGGDPFGGTEEWTAGTILADEQGKIKGVSASITRMFHYESDRELVGRSITVLIPEDKRALHEAGLKRIRDTGMLPDPMNIVCAEGLTRDGQRFPIDLQLSAWKGPNGKFTFNATVKERFDEPGPSLAEMTAAPEFVAPQPPFPPPAAAPPSPEKKD